MKNTYLINLYNLFFRIVVHGLIPVIPIIALSTGMGNGEVGFFNALLLCGILTGTLLSGKLLRTFTNAKQILLASSMVICVLLYMHRFNFSTINLYVFTVLLWLMFGIQINVINIILGSISAKKAGKIYGSLNITNILGTILGGICIGLITQKLDYAHMFVVLSLVFIIPIIVSGFIKVNTRVKDTEIRTNVKTSTPGYNYFFMAVFCIGMLLFMLRLGISLAMNAQGFSVSSISYSTTIGTILSLPFPFIFGKLADKYKLRNLFILCYIAGFAGLLFLMSAATNAFFILSVMFLSILSYAGDTLSGAHISKLSKIDKTVFFSKYGVVFWTGGIIGYLITGVFIDYLGFSLTFMVGALLAFVAILFITLHFQKIKRYEEHSD